MVDAVRSGHQVQGQGGVSYAADDGADVHEPQQGLGPVAGQGDSAVGGLESDYAAVVRRLANGAADITADA